MLDHATLKARERAGRDGWPAEHALRVHRAISWIGRAERAGDDDDARFLFLWIAFNAAYADEAGMHAFGRGERSTMSEFFARLVECDTAGRIHTAIWKRFAGPVRELMLSRYLFNPFWRHHNGEAGCADWEARLNASARSFIEHFRAERTDLVLSFLFDRLYVLRNQIVHGGATWNSSVNRAQVKVGAEILGVLVPVFVDIMMASPNADWGRPSYPVVGD